MWYRLLKFSHLLFGQLDVKGSNVLLQVLDVLGARDGEHIPPLVVHPGQCQLPCLTALLVCQLPNLSHKLVILQENDVVIKISYQEQRNMIYWLLCSPTATLQKK